MIPYVNIIELEIYKDNISFNLKIMSIYFLLFMIYISIYINQ